MYLKCQNHDLQDVLLCYNCVVAKPDPDGCEVQKNLKKFKKIFFFLVLTY